MNPNELAHMGKTLETMVGQFTALVATVGDAPQSVGLVPAESIIDLTDNKAADDDLRSATICYDQSDQKFHKLMPSGQWVRLSQSSVETHLMAAGYSPWPPKGSPMSDIDYKVVDIQSRHYVHFVGSVAGYPKGILVQGSTRILVPDEAKFFEPAPGSWDMLRGILEKMFGPEQLLYVYGWLKVSLAMFAARTWMAGQVMAVCGKRESGKNLFAWIVRQLFGGRVGGKPFSYMTKGTEFNSDLIGAELLTIEDEISSTGYHTRKTFGDRIKDMAANSDKRMHKKGVEALTVAPLQRLVISANEDQESLQVFPPINHGVADKIMLLLVEKHPLPMKTNTAAGRLALQDALRAEMPAFVDYLQSWQIPDHLVNDRFGITHYHHPDLLAHLKQVAPEHRLLELIDEVLFTVAKGRTPWSGKAIELERQLRTWPQHEIAREAAALLPGRESCGRYLSRLSEDFPNRISKRSGGGGICIWTIEAPETSDGDVGPEANDELPFFKNMSPEVMAKLKRMVSARTEAPPASVTQPVTATL